MTRQLQPHDVFIMKPFKDYEKKCKNRLHSANHSLIAFRKIKKVIFSVITELVSIAWNKIRKEITHFIKKCIMTNVMDDTEDNLI